MTDEIFEPFQIYRKVDGKLQIFFGLRRMDGTYSVIFAQWWDQIPSGETERQKLFSDQQYWAVTALSEDFAGRSWHPSKLKALAAFWPADATPLRELLSKRD